MCAKGTDAKGGSIIDLHWEITEIKPVLTTKGKEAKAWVQKNVSINKIMQVYHKGGVWKQMRKVASSKHDRDKQSQDYVRSRQVNVLDYFQFISLHLITPLIFNQIKFFLYTVRNGELADNNSDFKSSKIHHLPN